MYVVVALCGMVIGVILGHAWPRKKRYLGTLTMDHSTGDPLLFLELHVPVEYVMSRKDATFNVGPQE